MKFIFHVKPKKIVQKIVILHVSNQNFFTFGAIEKDKNVLKFLPVAQKIASFILVLKIKPTGHYL